MTRYCSLTCLRMNEPPISAAPRKLSATTAAPEINQLENCVSQACHENMCYEQYVLNQAVRPTGCNRRGDRVSHLCLLSQYASSYNLQHFLLWE